MKIRQPLFFLVLLCFLLSGCGTLWEKDNTPAPSPLVPLKPALRPRQVWDARIDYGANPSAMKFNPLIWREELIIVSQTGSITALNKHNGRTLWRAEVPAPLTSGVAVNDQVLVVGGKNGEVFALSTV